MPASLSPVRNRAGRTSLHGVFMIWLVLLLGIIVFVYSNPERFPAPPTSPAGLADSTVRSDSSVPATVPESRVQAAQPEHRIELIGEGGARTILVLGEGFASWERQRSVIRELRTIRDDSLRVQSFKGVYDEKGFLVAVEVLVTSP